MQTEDLEWAAAVRATSAHRRSLGPEAIVELGRQNDALMAEVQHVLDDDPASPAVQAIAVRWATLVREMNGPAVPLETLLRCGRATYRDALRRKPELAASPWGRAISLLGRAAALRL